MVTCGNIFIAIDIITCMLKCNLICSNIFGCMQDFLHPAIQMRVVELLVYITKSCHTCYHTCYHKLAKPFQEKKIYFHKRKYFFKNVW